MYMTSALSKNDMKAIGLQMALDLLAAKEQKDSITGLRTRTQPGRPDWSKVKGWPRSTTKIMLVRRDPCSPNPLFAGGGHHGRAPFQSGRMHRDIQTRGSLSLPRESECHGGTGRLSCAGQQLPKQAGIRPSPGRERAVPPPPLLLSPVP